MAIIRQLVEVHNGEIHVVSTYGEGTTFTVTLPDAEKE
jgi:signal transduction histidine kinase